MATDNYDKVCRFQSRWEWRLPRLLFSPFYSFSVTGCKEEVIRSLSGKPVIFAGAPHLYHWEMWMQFPQLEQATYDSTLPLRFVARDLGPVVKKLAYDPNACIVLPTREQSKGMTQEELLAPALRALELNHSVVMYPEGHLFRGEGEVLRPFRSGIAFLHRASWAPVVPIVMKMGVRDLIGRRRVHLVFGEPINFIPGQNDADRAEWLRQHMTDLYQSIGTK